MSMQSKFKRFDRVRIKFGVSRGEYGSIISIEGDDGTYYGVKLDSHKDPVGYSEYELESAMNDPYFGSSVLNEVAIQIRKYILKKNILTVSLMDLCISTNFQLHYLDGFCELIAMGFLIKPSIRLNEGVFLPTYDFCKKVNIPEEKYMELINKLGEEYGE